MRVYIYPAEIRVRAEVAAERISKIEDPERRKYIARQACLYFVQQYPNFPEEFFLKQCGAPVRTALGPALKVKKSAYHVRTKKDGEQWDDVSRTHRRKQFYRSNRGIDVDCGEEDEGEGLIIPALGGRGRRSPTFIGKEIFLMA